MIEGDASPGRLAARPGLRGRVALVSPRLEAEGILHGFTTRVGGLDIRTADDLAGPMADAGATGLGVWIGRQTHGTRVSLPEDRSLPADAHLSPPGGGGVAVRTADCLGVLLSGPRGVVAAHAGWRGLVAGVLGAAAEAAGGGHRIRAVAIGPAIGAQAFEIGPEVAACFQEAGLSAHLRPGRGDRHLADLQGAALAQLTELGVPASRIDLAARCTFSDRCSFYSYRRDGPGQGHQAAWICPPGSNSRGAPSDVAGRS